MIMFLNGVANQSRDRIFFDSQQSLTKGMKLFLYRPKLEGWLMSGKSMKQAIPERTAEMISDRVANVVRPLFLCKSKALLFGNNGWQHQPATSATNGQLIKVKSM